MRCLGPGPHLTAAASRDRGERRVDAAIVIVQDPGTRTRWSRLQCKHRVNTDKEHFRKKAISYLCSMSSVQ